MTQEGRQPFDWAPVGSEGEPLTSTRNIVMIEGNTEEFLYLADTCYVGVSNVCSSTFSHVSEMTKVVIKMSASTQVNETNSPAEHSGVVGLSLFT